MRRMPLILLVVMSGAAAPALGAPICQTRQGDFVHCENPQAMPVGWHVSDTAYTNRILAHAPRAGTSDLLAAGMVLACLFVIIALLPKFDGARDEDWEA